MMQGQPSRIVAQHYVERGARGNLARTEPSRYPLHELRLPRSEVTREQDDIGSLQARSQSPARILRFAS